MSPEQAAGVKDIDGRRPPRTGRRSEARRILDSLSRTVDSASFASPAVAYAYTALGEKDQAFKVLFRVVTYRHATHLKADPPVDRASPANESGPP